MTAKKKMPASITLALDPRSALDRARYAWLRLKKYRDGITHTHLLRQLIDAARSSDSSGAV